MGDWLTIRVGALVLVTAFFGAMIFFMLLFLPTVIRFLPCATTTLLMRQLFLVYSWVMRVVGNLPSLMLVGYPVYLPEALALSVVAGVSFVQRYALMPLLNRQPVASNELRANGVHGPSVAIHSLQWVTASEPWCGFQRD